jgi:universal stress protein A
VGPKKALVYLRKILITTDLSEFSLAAMEYATTFGLLYLSKLYLLHVLDYTPPKFYGRDRDAESQAHRLAAEEEAMKELTDFVTKKIGPDAGLIPVIRSGSPAHIIRRFAEEEGVDLIVMATHGRTGLRHILMGSVAEKVVRTSSVPVMTVKPQPLREIILDDEDIESELHLR